MRKSTLLNILCIIILALAAGSCTSDVKKDGRKVRFVLQGTFNQKSNLPFDSTLITSFYESYPELSKYKSEVIDVYRQHKFSHLWFDEQGVVEFGYTLFSKVREMDVEGVPFRFPYQKAIDGVFDNKRRTKLSDVDTELMLTNLYLFYTEKVYEGLDEATTKSLGWHLPRKTFSFANILDSLISEPEGLKNDDSLMYSQFHKLRAVLKHYRQIQTQGGWKTIDTNLITKHIVPGDTGKVIKQIRERLSITGEIKHNNKSNLYDPELVAAVKKFQKNNGYNVTEKILPEHVYDMNIPVESRLVKIILNMERCRWIPVEFDQVDEYIMVNIPSFNLKFVRNGITEIDSRVVVGANLTQTVVFSGKMSYIVFSPYWNLPDDIIEKEVKPGIEKDKDYLIKHNMEWSGNQLRQKPGKDNSLGLVKFMFPNSRDIYLHDTPAKNLFSKESRAFSHGCIRVGKARELAIAIMKNDPKWNPAKIDEAMNSGEETTYGLKRKIPVYIGYFTAMVDENGEINFYKDIYNRDGRLAQLLID